MTRKTKLIRAERLGIRDVRPFAPKPVISTAFSYGEYKAEERTREVRDHALKAALREALGTGPDPIDVDKTSRKVRLLTADGPVHIATYTTEKIILHRSSECEPPTVGLF